MLKTSIAPALAAVLAMFAVAPSHAQSQVQVGLLDCAVKSGDASVLGSAKDLSCTFQRASDTPPDIYFGQIRRVGLELGATQGGVIQWFVFAPSTEIASGALSGDYIGVSAEATLGVGIGANALIGGGDDSFILQPVSVSSQVGVNLAAGITELELRSFD